MLGNKRKHVIILIISVIYIIGTYCFVQNLKAGLVFALVLWIIELIPYKKIAVNERYIGMYYACILVASSFVAAFLSQFLLNGHLLLLGWRKALLETMICAILAMLLFFITLNYKIAAGIMSFLVIMFSAINYYVYEFKGNELQPRDIYAVSTALKVVNGYQIVIAPTVLYTFILWSIFVLFIFQMPKYVVVKKQIIRTVSLACCFSLSLFFILLSNPIHAKYFLNGGTTENGYLLNFILQMRSTRIDAPDNYSEVKIKELSDYYINLKPENENRKFPDIIVIMDESYAYLDHLGDKLNCNIEPTPYIKSLSENTIHGYALTSIFGGGTPNSEYEFLSGNSLIFLPEGSYVYSQYIKEPVPNMVSTLHSLGYKTIGMHPYFPKGWNRDIVYPLLGFDETYFLDSFQGCETIRKSVSDKGMFEKITQYYETNAKKKGASLFLFGVTMQNHGGYDYTGEDFFPNVKLENYSRESPKAEQYLSLLNETDSAVEYLLQYFKGVDRDVVIVFFGDHYPSLDEWLYSEIHGGPFITLEEKQLRYEIPFFIWTNYPSAEQEIELTSLNYLSNYVYKAANIPLPPYNRFLEEMQDIIPAINSLGYYSNKEQKFLTLSNASGEEYEKLNQYNMLVYNSLCDLDNLGAIFR